MREWSTWSGSFRSWIDDEPAPENLKQLIDLVRGLSVQNGDRIHAEGSKWAFSAPAYCENRVVNTDKLHNFPDALQGAINSPRAGGKLLIAVEGGIKVRDLYLALYGRPDRPFGGGPTPPVIAGEPSTWVLPVLGGAGGQSIAGVINTGTHGGDAMRPPLSDCVRAMLVVGSGGIVRLIQPTQKPPIVDVARLRAALEPSVPGITIEDHQEDELLAAAVVSVGRFGVVYAYVLEVVNENGLLLLESRTKESWAAPGGTRERLAAELADAAANDRFLQIVFNPNRRPDRDHTAFVTRHKIIHAAEIPSGSRFVLDARAPRGAMLIFQQMCGTSITPELDALRRGLADAAAALPFTAPALIVLSAVAIGSLPYPLGLIGPLLVTTLGVAIPVIVGLLASVSAKLGTIGPDHIIGDVIADILNEATDLGFPALVDIVTGALLDGQQSDKLPAELTGSPDQPWLVHGTRFEIADFFDYTHPDCYRGDSIEVFFDATDAARLGDTIERLLDLFDRMRSDGVAFGGYVSLRFMARSQALLGLSRWDRACSVEVAAIRGLRGNDRGFIDVRDFTLANGGVVHWGQINTVSSEQVMRSFGPSLDAFHRRLQEIEGGSLLFRTPFSSDRRLELPLSGDPWSSWEPLGLVTGFAAGIGNAGFGRPLEIYAANQSNVIFSRERRIDGRADTPWTEILHQPASGPPVLARSHDGRRELFVYNRLHTPGRRVQHTFEMGRPGGAFASWDTFGFLSRIEIDSDPVVAAHTDGRLEWFAKGALFEGRQRMAHCWANLEGSWWTDVWELGLDSIGTPPAACHRNLGSDQIVAVAAWNGAVRVIQQVGPAGDSGWTEWTDLVPASGPPLQAGGVGGPIIVEVSGTGATVHVLAMDGRGEVFTTHDLLGGLTLSWSPREALPSTAGYDFLAPECRLTTVMTDRLYLFGRSQRGQVLEAEFLPGSGWSPWQNLGGEIAGDIGAGVHEDGRVEIVARRADTGELQARRQRAPGIWA